MMNLLAFFSYVFITTFTPGPNNILSMALGQRLGWRKSLPFMLGVTLGFLLVGSLCFLITTSLYRWLPQIEIYLKILGTLYILFLAYKIVFSPSKNASTLQGLTSGRAVIQGLLLQFINVKIILFFLTASSVFLLPAGYNTPLLTLYLLCMVAIGTLSNFAWCGAGALFQHFLQQHAQITNIILALLLLYCAIAIWL